MTSNSSKSNAVVVIGGGFGGLSTVLALSSCKERPPIILIEPRFRFVFLPLLYEFLSGELEGWEVAPDYRNLLSSRGIVLIDQKVNKIDLENEVVCTSSGQVIQYAQLVISTGSQSDDFGIEGVKEYCYRFHKYEDVSILKNLILHLNCLKVKEQNLAIIGAGPTGVELACKISDLLDDQITIHLIELGKKVLPNGKSFNQEQIEQALMKKSIKVHLNTRLLKINANSLELKTEQLENSHSWILNHSGAIWTAGVKSSMPEGLPQTLLKDGRVLINQNLNIIGYQNAFAIGDIALDEANPQFSTAQVALQQGQHLAFNIMNLRKDKSLNSFKFIDRGEMLSMGIGEATITGMGITIAGSIAFQIRRIAYLSKFPNLSLGVRSAMAWFLNDGKKLI